MFFDSLSGALRTRPSAQRTFVDSVGGLRDGALLTPRETWDSFWEFARMPLGESVTRDFDGLLYSYGLHVSSGRELFHFNLVRQVGVPGSDEFLTFNWELTYELTPQLLAVGRHRDRWFPGCGVTRRDWRISLAQRPEWRILDTLAPVSVSIYSDES